MYLNKKKRPTPESEYRLRDYLNEYHARMYEAGLQEEIPGDISTMDPETYWMLMEEYGTHIQG